MRKISFLLILLILPAVSGFSILWELRTGVHFTPGLFYNGSWDPGYNGSAVNVMISAYPDILYEGGLEIGYDLSGLYVLLPLGVGFPIASWFGGTVGGLHAVLTVLPGLKLNRPSPYFLIACEASLRAVFQLGGDISLQAAVGPRYTYSPDYTAQVGPYHYLDLTIEIAAAFVTGR